MSNKLCFIQTEFNPARICFSASVKVPYAPFDGNFTRKLSIVTSEPASGIIHSETGISSGTISSAVLVMPPPASEPLIAPVSELSKIMSQYSLRKSVYDAESFKSAMNFSAMARIVSNRPPVA